MPFSFEALDVYKKAVAFGVSVLEMARRFPNDCTVLTEELGKAAVAVSSCIALGGSVWNKGQKKQLFLDARGACFRCAAILAVTRDLGLAKESDSDGMNEQIEIISKMLTKLAQSTDRSEKDPYRREMA